MDEDDLSSALRELDDPDSEQFSKKNKSKNEDNSSKTALSNAAKSSFDDFDANDDDDDLDDLLNDDDGDFFLKKKTKKSPEKILSPPKTPPKSTKMSDSMKKIFQLDSSPEESPEIEKKLLGSPVHHQTSPIKSKNASLKSDHQKSSLFERESSLPSPAKTSKNKIDLFMEEESKYLDDLGLDSLEKKTSTSLDKAGANKRNENSRKTLSKKNSVFSDGEDDDILDSLNKSPEKIANKKKQTNLKNTPLKRSDSNFSDDDDDDGGILDSLDSLSNVKNSPQKIKSSLLDDLFSKPKEGKKNSPQKDFSSVLQDKYKKTDKKEKIDDDDIFGGYVPSYNRSSSARRNVKFEEDSTTQIESPQRPHTSSSKKESRSKNIDTDDDWLGLLKKDSKSGLAKDPKSSTQGKEDEKVGPNFSRRKSSSADWLGLNESPPLSSSKISSNLEQHNKVAKSNNEVSSHKEELPWLSSSTSKITSPLKTASPSKTSSSSKTALPLKTSSSSKTLQESTKNVAINEQKIKSSTPIGGTPVEVSESPSIQASFVATQHAVPIGHSSQVQHMPPTPTPPVYNISGIPPSSQNANIDFMSLQTMITSLQFEKGHLSKIIEDMKKRQDGDLKTFQNTLENQKKSFEQTFDLKLQSVKAEHESSLQNIKHQLESLEDDKKQIVKDNRAKLEIMEKDYKQQLEKLKELHNEAVQVMKRDHEETLSRLRQLKDREIDAISSTEVHTKSLQSLADQLGARASELASLQLKVDEKHQTALQDKQVALQAKEQELKALENRLQWQIEGGEQEKIRLQQLVLRLESRLQQQTKEGEEERWSMQQTKAKLEVHQKYLEEEKNTYFELTEREKERFRKSQEILMQEQRTIFQQIATERQQLTIEKRELESLSRRVKEEESKFNLRKMKEESSLESEKFVLHHEEDKLYAEREIVRQESQQLSLERQSLNREKEKLKDDKENVEEMKLMLKRKSDEIEALASKAALQKEEVKSQMARAQKIESSHHSKLNEITQRLHLLAEKEKELLLEKEQVNKFKQELEEKRSSMLCSKCKIAIGLPVTELPPNFHQLSTAPTFIPTVANFQAYPNVFDPNLMIWYMSAQKEREYLENELDFVQSLKDNQKTDRKFNKL